jgi:hypothetical protein
MGGGRTKLRFAFKKPKTMDAQPKPTNMYMTGYNSKACGGGGGGGSGGPADQYLVAL